MLKWGGGDVESQCTPSVYTPAGVHEVTHILKYFIFGMLGTLQLHELTNTLHCIPHCIIG